MAEPTGNAPVVEDLRTAIREIPDFPKQGILFYDVTTLLKDARCFQRAIDILATPHIGEPIDYIVGIDARGFILGAALAYKLCKGLVVVRKKGKLPARTRTASYALEYGVDEIEMHHDALPAGARVIVVDDLLATGGTAAAACQLVRDSGATVVECAFLIELESLKGRQRLDGTRVVSLLRYP
ncbi:MAG: adenine phosphoribosyltransferase [Deltaproteobacteria bacterium]|nr:adenine phosphoribosyltransferase [Deltaproteobacteria bacterium]